MQLGLYRHYKNKDHIYRVLSIALEVESQQKMVVYQTEYDIPKLADAYGMRPVFVRTYDIFNSHVDIEGKKIPRFEYIGDSL